MFKNENLMKTSLLRALPLILAAVSPALADIQCIAPGVPAGTVTATKVPFKLSYELKNCYKFVFSAIQAKGDTLGAPGSSGTQGNGGQFHLSATVSGGDTCSSPVKEGKITFRNVQDYNTAPLKTIVVSPGPTVFKATTRPIDIELEWAGQGNAHKPNGTFAIVGEYQKNPPVPVGSLNFPVGNWLLVSAGTQPAGVATITRE